MRIGIMLRAFDEKGGVGVYARNITKHLVESDQKNDYFLYYASLESFGSFTALQLGLLGGSPGRWPRARSGGLESR